MGLIDLLNEVNGVFVYLQNFWSALPNVIQILVYAAFGGLIFIAVLRSIWR